MRVLVVLLLAAAAVHTFAAMSMMDTPLEPVTRIWCCSLLPMMLAVGIAVRSTVRIIAGELILVKVIFLAFAAGAMERIAASQVGVIDLVGFNWTYLISGLIEVLSVVIIVYVLGWEPRG